MGERIVYSEDGEGYPIVIITKHPEERFLTRTIGRINVGYIPKVYMSEAIGRVAAANNITQEAATNLLIEAGENGIDI